MRLTGLALAAACALAAAPATAAAQDEPPPPPNDHYLDSLRVNQAGQALPRNETIRDARDTTSATEQADMFAPPQSGGPPEPINCDGTPFGKTIWYDIYPDRPVIAQITANAVAFDPVIGIVRFDPETAQPLAGTCINRLSFTAEQMIIPLERGGAYSVQIGGAHFTGGPVETLFDFARPPAIDAAPTLSARATRTGIRVSRLVVDAPRGARIEVRCSRGVRRCRRQVRTAVNAAASDPWRPLGDNARMAGASSAGPRAEAARRLTFTRVRGAALRARQSIEIRVTQPGFIGRYVKYTARRGGFRRVNRCLEPGSRTPRRRCG